MTDHMIMENSERLNDLILSDWREVYKKYFISGVDSLLYLFLNERNFLQNAGGNQDITEEDLAHIRALLDLGITADDIESLRNIPDEALTHEEVENIRARLANPEYQFTQNQVDTLIALIGIRIDAIEIRYLRLLMIRDTANVVAQHTAQINGLLGCAQAQGTIGAEPVCVDPNKLGETLTYIHENLEDIKKLISRQKNGDLDDDGYSHKPKDLKRWKILSKILNKSFYADLDSQMTMIGRNVTTPISSKKDDYVGSFNGCFIYDILISQIDLHLIINEHMKIEAFPNTTEGLCETWIDIQSSAHVRFLIQKVQIGDGNEKQEFLSISVAHAPVAPDGNLYPETWFEDEFKIALSAVISEPGIVVRFYAKREWDRIDQISIEDTFGYKMKMGCELLIMKADLSKIDENTERTIDAVKTIKCFENWQPGFTTKESYKVDITPIDYVSSYNNKAYFGNLFLGLKVKTSDIIIKDTYKNEFVDQNSLMFVCADANASRFLCKGAIAYAAGPLFGTLDTITGYDFKRQENMLQTTKEQQLGLTSMVNKIAHGAIMFGNSTIIDSLKKIHASSLQACLVSGILDKFNKDIVGRSDDIIQYENFKFKAKTVWKNIKIDQRYLQIFNEIEKQGFDEYITTYNNDDGVVSTMNIFIGTDIIIDDSDAIKFNFNYNPTKVMRYPESEDHPSNIVTNFSCNRMNMDDWVNITCDVKVKDIRMWAFVFDPEWILPPGSENDVAIEITGDHVRDFVKLEKFESSEFVTSDGMKYVGLMCTKSIMDDLHYKDGWKDMRLKLRIVSANLANNAETYYKFHEYSLVSSSVMQSSIPLAKGRANIEMAYQYKCVSTESGPLCGFEAKGINSSIDFTFGGGGCSSIILQTGTKEDVSITNKDIFFDEYCTKMFENERKLKISGSLVAPSKPVTYMGVRRWDMMLQGNSAAIKSLISTVGFLYKEVNSLDDRLEIIFKILEKGSNTISTIEKFMNTASMISFVVAPYVGVALGVSATLLDIVNNGANDASDWVNALLAGATYAILAVHQVYKKTPPNEVKAKIKQQIKKIDKNLTNTIELGRRVKGYFGLDSTHYAEWSAKTGETHRNVREIWRRAGLLEVDEASRQTIPKEVEVSQAELGRLEANCDAFGEVEVLANTTSDISSSLNGVGMDSLIGDKREETTTLINNPAVNILRKIQAAPEHSYIRMKWRSPKSYNPETKTGTYTDNVLVTGLGDFSVQSGYTRIVGSDPELRYSHSIGKFHACSTVEYKVLEDGTQYPLDSTWSLNDSVMHPLRISRLCSKYMDLGRESGRISHLRHTEVMNMETGKQYSYLCNLFNLVLDGNSVPPKHQVVKKVPILNVDARNFILHNIEKLPWNYSIYKNNCQHFTEGLHSYLTTGRIPKFMAHEKNIMKHMSDWFYNESSLAVEFK